MEIHSPKSAPARTGPGAGGLDPAAEPGGEGGNARRRPAARLAALLGANGLLAAALLLSAIFVGLATAALN